MKGLFTAVVWILFISAVLIGAILIHQRMSPATTTFLYGDDLKGTSLRYEVYDLPELKLMGTPGDSTVGIGPALVRIFDEENRLLLETRMEEQARGIIITNGEISLGGEKSWRISDLNAAKKTNP